MSIKPRDANIMIVDDTPANLKLLVGMLGKHGYSIRPFPRGKLALNAAENDPPDLILLDINMPEMNGYEVCKRLKSNETLVDIPVIFISALNETMDKVKAFSAGGVDYVTKPFQFEEVKARVETHLKLRSLQIELKRHNQNLEELVQEQVREISNSQMATIFALSKLAESRDDDTGKHLERVQGYCHSLARKLKEQPEFWYLIDDAYIENITHASALHDIGKVGISDTILCKPGKLTEEEFNTMKAHTTLGAHTLHDVKIKYPNNAFINMGISIAHYHHEKWDGSGYPEERSGQDIPLCARIMALADVYDALRSKRCYKEAFSHQKSCEIIKQGIGTHFDPMIVSVFSIIHEEIAQIHERLNP